MHFNTALTHSGLEAYTCITTHSLLVSPASPPLGALPARRVLAAQYSSSQGHRHLPIRWSPQTSLDSTPLPPAMGRLANRFDLEKQMTFYLSYHYNQINKYIHFTCIWPILFTSFMLVAETKPFIEQPAFFASLPLGQYLVLNVSALGAVLYMAWYIALDRIAGSIAAALVFGAYVFGNYFSQTAPTAFGVSAWKIALPLFIVLWIAQFIGHGVFERRKPALLDSFDQALITAPLFVLLEFMFLFGYRQEFHDRVMDQVRINVLEFHGKEAFEKIFGQDETTPLIARAV